MSEIKIKDNIQKLTSKQIQELAVDEAMRVIEKNCNNLADIEKALFDVIAELGKWNVKLQQLKSYKAMVIEQNRGLKIIIQNG